jgi:hypothetical protein
MKWQAIKHRIQKLISDKTSGFDKYSFNEVLSILVRERFIARASQSTIRDSIILKGGLLLTMIYTKQSRFTNDADINLKSATDLKSFQNAMDKIILVDLDDGFSFSRNEGKVINHESRLYEGAEFKILCKYSEEQKDTSFTLDIGVGDSVEPVAGKLPTFTEFDATSLEIAIYPPETIAAEKLQTCIVKRDDNSRMKDYYDLYLLRDVVDIKKFHIVAKTTFAKRKTAYPGQLPEKAEKIDLLETRWSNFLRSKQYRILKTVPKDFKEIMKAIREFYGTNE